MFTLSKCTFYYIIFYCVSLYCYVEASCRSSDAEDRRRRVSDPPPHHTLVLTTCPMRAELSVRPEAEGMLSLMWITTVAAHRETPLMHLLLLSNSLFYFNTTEHFLVFGFSFLEYVISHWLYAENKFCSLKSPLFSAYFSLLSSVLQRCFIWCLILCWFVGTFLVLVSVTKQVSNLSWTYLIK